MVVKTSTGSDISFESIKSELSASGSLLPFKKWSEAAGYDLSVKEDRTAARNLYNIRAGEFSRQGKAALAAIATDARLNLKKLKFVVNSKGEFVGYDSSLRLPTKASVAAAAKAAETQKVAVAEAQTAAALGKLEAAREALAQLVAGTITAEQFDAILAAE